MKPRLRTHRNITNHLWHVVTLLLPFFRYNTLLCYQILQCSRLLSGQNLTWRQQARPITASTFYLLHRLYQHSLNLYQHAGLVARSNHLTVLELLLLVRSKKGGRATQNLACHPYARKNEPKACLYAVLFHWRSSVIYRSLQILKKLELHSTFANASIQKYHKDSCRLLLPGSIISGYLVCSRYSASSSCT